MGGAGMKGRAWLAIDTATDIASVAVGKPPDAEAGVFVQGARRHAAEIIVLIEHALEQAGVRPNELEGIVVGDGPGSFTGLRIGWAAAKGLAQQAGLSLAAVPSLMAAAATVARQLGPVPVAACYDALRGQVYGAVYVFHADAVETRVAPTPTGSVPPSRLTWRPSRRSSARSSRTPGRPTISASASPPRHRSSSPSAGRPSRATRSRTSRRTKGRS